MRLFKIQGSSDLLWPLDSNDSSSVATANSDSETAEHSDDVVLDLGSPRRPIA